MVPGVKAAKGSFGVKGDFVLPTMGGSLAIVSYWTAMDIAGTLKPRYVISLMDPLTKYVVPAGPTVEEHLRLEVNDIDNDGLPVPPPYVGPAAVHVEGIVQAGQTWDRNSNVLVHCMAGVSRSAGAAMVFLAAAHPDRLGDLPGLLRQRGPWLAPNRAIVRLGDRLLGLEGRLLDALDRMGEPTMRGPTGPVLIPLSAWPSEADPR